MWLGYALKGTGTGPTPPSTQIILLSATTTSAAAVQFLRDDNGLPLAPPNGKTWKVKLEVASRRSVGATVGDSSGWEVSFTLKRIGGVLSIIGVSTMVYSQTDASTATITFNQPALDATAVLQATGEAARTDLWKATAYITEI